MYNSKMFYKIESNNNIYEIFFYNMGEDFWESHWECKIYKNSIFWFHIDLSKDSIFNGAHPEEWIINYFHNHLNLTGLVITKIY